MAKFFLSNPLQKILALALAITIWVLAPSIEKKGLTESQFFVPVTYVNLSKNLEIVSERLQSISVTVELPREEIQNVNPSMFQAVIDLESAAPGEIDFELSPDILTTPPNVRAVNISPTSLTMTFEEVIEKVLPIKPVFTGEIAGGYVLEKVTMDPERVRVRGPISILSTLEQLETKSINIAGTNSDYDLIVQIAFPARVTEVDPKPEFYAARIQVGSEPVNLRFEKIPVGIVNQEYVTSINPNYLDGVLLRGPRSIMQYLKKDDIQAFIDLKNMAPGKYVIKAPTIRLQPEIQIMEMWGTIHVWVKNQEIK